MKQRLSPQTKTIRRMLSQGIAPKDIAKKLKISRQVVYNAQYYMRKREEARVGGIAALEPKREAMPRTGITMTPLVKKEITEFRTVTPAPTPAPTLWQRIKKFFSFPL